MVDEGYPVTAGQVVARMDTRDLEATTQKLHGPEDPGRT